VPLQSPLAQLSTRLPVINSSAGSHAAVSTGRPIPAAAAGGGSSCISHLFVLGDRSWGGLAQQDGGRIPVWRQQLMMV